MASAIEADGTSWNFRDETKLQGGGVARDGGGGRAGHAQGDGPAQLVDDVVPSGAKSSSHDHDSSHAHDDQSGASTAKFSDDGSQVLQRDVSEAAVPRQPLAASDLAMQYEIQRCCEEIRARGSKRVALQFPDTMLPDASSVASELGERTGAAMYVLGDTSYGSCCVDEVAADHVGADLVIHYGPSCLSQPSRLPVLYVFGRAALDTDRCVAWLQAAAGVAAAAGRQCVVVFDVTVAHAVSVLQERVGTLPGVTWSELCLPRSSANGGAGGASQSDGSKDETRASHDGWENRFGRRMPPSASASVADSEGGAEAAGGDADTRAGESTSPRVAAAMLYLGPRNRTLTNLMMHYADCDFYVFDPFEHSVPSASAKGHGSSGDNAAVDGDARGEVNPAVTAQVEPPRGGNKLLARRYYLMQCARDASVVGILAGTLGVAGCVDTMRELRRICQRAGKKTYTFAVGKVNVAKLANFMEIDVFVLVACPENSLLDSKEFFKPIVTPHEMRCACVSETEWVERRYELELDHVGDVIRKNIVDMPDKPADGGARFSFIKGAVIRDTLSSSTAATDGSDDLTLSVRSTSGAVAERPAARFLANRTYGGLEQRVGETEVVDVIEGRRGIAASYEEEPDQT